VSKFAIAGVAILAALIMSFAVRSAPVAANPDNTAAVWCGFFATYHPGGSAATCDGSLTADDLLMIAGDDNANGVIDAGEGDNGFGDEDGVFEFADVADADLDANQITDGGAFPLNTIYVIAFVDNDGTVTFDSDAGATVAVNNDGEGGEALPAADGNSETCDGPDDLDCGTSTLDNGDGVVVATITEGTADAGDEVDVDVIQDGVSLTETLQVVGVGNDIALTLVESTIQTDAGNDCGDLLVTDDEALGNPDSTIAIAVVTDNDDVPLTREAVTLVSDDTDIAAVEANTAVTVDGGDSGIAYFAVVCGGDDTGVATLTADGGGEDTDADITVVGEAATVALTASPAAIACDGTATSTVTATVTDSEGNNVANGTSVTFSVVALGTANPINTTTTDGTASSTITPLSGATAGVTVIVSAGDASASIRVDCLPELATPVGPQPTPTGGTGVTPPDTGTGGYLGQDSSAGFPMWTLVALGLGSLVLVGGGMVTRRSGK
jgi:hypothetical protein